MFGFEDVLLWCIASLKFRHGFLQCKQFIFLLLYLLGHTAHLKSILVNFLNEHLLPIYIFLRSLWWSVPSRFESTIAKRLHCFSHSVNFMVRSAVVWVLLAKIIMHPWCSMYPVAYCWSTCIKALLIAIMPWSFSTLILSFVNETIEAKSIFSLISVHLPVILWKSSCTCLPQFL